MLRQTFIWTALPKAVKQLPAAGNPTIGLELSVLVSPRLQDDEPLPTGQPPRTHVLASFPDLLDWPATLQQLTLQEQAFLVRFDGGPPLPARDVKVRPLPQLAQQPTASQLWKALFKENTRVDSYRFDDFSQQKWNSYPAGQLARSIREGYVEATDAVAGGGVDLLEAVKALERLLFRLLSVPPIGLPFPLPPFPLPDLPPLPGVPPVGGSVGVDVSVSREAVEPAPEGRYEGSGALEPRALFGTPGAPGSGALPGVPPLPVPGSGGLPGVPPLPEPPGVPGVPGPLRSAVGDLLNFHLTPLGPQPKEPDEEALRQLLDFHQMVAVLGEHPAVMRQLGLVVDIEVVLPVDLLSTLFPFRTVQVQPAVPPVLLKTKTFNHFPPTSCRVEGNLFLASPRADDPETRDGMLRLGEDRYRVEQFDVDGAVFKIRGQATSVRAMAANLSPTMPTDVSLPALRSAGVTVYRDDRNEEMKQASERAAQRNNQMVALETVGVDSGAGEPLFAEDVTAGYRVDVWDDVSRQWHSLHRRVATYTFKAPETGPPVAVQEPEDEGFLETVVTQHPDGPGAGLFVSPAVFTWEGWSLSAPRPGNHIENPKNEETAKGVANTTVPTEMKLTIETNAKPGSLPRLRFGRRYRFRARAVDLAGNSRDLFPVDPSQFPDATGELRYGRFEPVPSPPMVLTAPAGGGESVDAMVARSDPWRDETLPAALDERYLVPPKVSQLTAELHGGFDGATAVDPNTHHVAVREAASLPPIIPVPSQPGAQLTIPYLPDPMARGVLFVGLPGEEQRAMPDGSRASLTHVPFEGPWPDRAPFRLRIVGIRHDQAPARPQLLPPTSTDEAILRVEVPEAHRYTMRLSCHISRPPTPGAEPDPAELDRLHHMAMWQWIEQLAPEPQKPRLRREAAQGRNWLLMPYREITVVHAVQRPVLKPHLVDDASFVISKDLGSTVARVKVDAVVHGLSTSKVDLLAAWDDRVDDPANELNDPKNDIIKRHATLGRRNTADTESRVTIPQGEHHFGDTKHHLVSYRALATTSFREYFPEKEPDPDPKHREDRTKDIPLEFTVDGPVVEKHVPSSARPLAPSVVHAVPIFSWARSGTQSVRTARGIRVYFHRPWWTSGVGEKVAVLFVPGPPLSDDDLRKPLVTAWAADPVWGSPPPPPLTAAAFVGRDDQPVPVRPGLTLEELPQGMTVDAAEYDVDFDPDRKLWFTDVTFAVGARYFPFVKLAVARFQPVSLPGVELSRVAVTDFVQLPPDRRASVVVGRTTAGGEQASFEVSGVVPVHSEGSQPGKVTVTSTLRATVLRRGSGDVEWVVDKDQVPVQSSDRDGVRTWTGTVEFAREADVRRKLVFEEVEAYRRNP